MNGLRTMGVALALTLAATLGAAEELVGFTQTVSGSAIDTAIDTNGDGVAAASFQGAAKGFRGVTSYQGLQEVQFTPTGLCEPGEVEGIIVAYSIVRRFSNGDLLFSRLVDGSFCLDPATGKASVAVNAEIFGGTGQYEGATGSYQIAYEITALLPDPTGGIAHGGFVGTATGTVSEPAPVSSR